jgi:protein CLEC16A
LSARSSRRKSSSPKALKPDFSYNGLQALLDELIAITGGAENPSQVVNTSPDYLVELIRLIAETLLWGEQNQSDSSMFDQFCERGIMKVFVNLLNSPGIITTSSGLSIFTSTASAQSAQVSSNRQIKVQLLQTMSLLVLNIKRETSLYFLFSNNSINQLIQNNNNLDFSDEEILSYYVTFMKSIALRLSRETVKLFMNEKSTNYFPLFIQSIRFFDHHDRMIRIAVRTITLSILKLFPSHPGLGKFLTDNTGGYFSLIASQLRDMWLLIDRTIDDLGVVPASAIESGLSVIFDELIDQFEYIAEIYRLILMSHFGKFHRH